MEKLFNLSCNGEKKGNGSKKDRQTNTFAVLNRTYMEMQQLLEAG
jgi:hypothetical protein